MSEELDLSNLTKPDVQRILHVLRDERDKLTEIKTVLEERLRTIGDGETTGLRAEIALCEKEIHNMGAIISKLWVIVTAIKH